MLELAQRTIVCLCGSTRFMQAFQQANLLETLAGRIVLTIGCDTKSDAMLNLDEQVKMELDAWKQGKRIRWLEEPISLDELIKRLEVQG